MDGNKIYIILVCNTSYVFCNMYTEVLTWFNFFINVHSVPRSWNVIRENGKVRCYAFILNLNLAKGKRKIY